MKLTAIAGWAGMAACLLAFDTMAGTTARVVSPLVQSDPCSSNGGYPEGSPGAVMAAIRGQSDGSYAACVQRRRAQQPVVGWSARQVRDVARQAVLDDLVEPSSAVFRSVRRIPHSSGTTTFCGEVNARNRAGGMMGFTRFRAGVTDRGQGSAQLDSTELLAGAQFDDAWATYCVGGTPVAF